MPISPWGDAGEAPLHVAARRWDVPMVERLVAARRRCLAPPRRRRHAAHARASSTATRRSPRGCSRTARVDELSPLERFIAACARGDRAGRRRDAGRSTRRCDRELRPEHHLMLHRPAESGNAAVLETMLACGFDPRAQGQGQRHAAAPRGDGRSRRRGARAAEARRRRQRARRHVLGAAAGVGRRRPQHIKRGGADHVGVARLLIAAGSPLEWTPPAGAPGPEGTLEGLIELRRDAGQNAF